MDRGPRGQRPFGRVHWPVGYSASQYLARTKWLEPAAEKGTAQISAMILSKCTPRWLGTLTILSTFSIHSLSRRPQARSVSAVNTTQLRHVLQTCQIYVINQRALLMYGLVKSSWDSSGVNEGRIGGPRRQEIT